MSDVAYHGETMCRNKRKALGLPYPRSSCHKCGPIIRQGWQCLEEVPEAPPELETSALDSRDPKKLCPRKPGNYCIVPGPQRNGLCCEIIQPDIPCNFSVVWRNPHHFDIYTQHGRAFRIRGEPGSIIVYDERVDDERPHPREPVRFRTVSAAQLWCAELLMLL